MPGAEIPPQRGEIQIQILLFLADDAIAAGGS